MDTKTELERAISERQKVVDQINEYEAKKQVLIQEALRLDGEVRILKKLGEKK